jgi:hypothetical protein
MNKQMRYEIGSNENIVNGRFVDLRPGLVGEEATAGNLL